MNTPRRIAMHSLLATAVTFAFMSPALAQDAAPAAAKGSAAAVKPQGISPEAKAVMDKMTAYMKTLKSYSIEGLSSRDEVLPSGYKLQHNEKASLVVQLPNHLRSQVSGDMRNRTFVYDGSKMTLYSPDKKAYARVDAPDTLAKLIDGVLDTGIDLPLIDVLYQGVAGTLTNDVTNGFVVGVATIEGVPCDHLAFRQPSADWQLWVSRGSQPLPRKIVITTREDADPQFIATMKWNLNPSIDKSTFSFVAPKGTREIPFDKPAAIAGAQ